MLLFATGWAFLVLHEPISAAQAVGGLGTCGAGLLAAAGGDPTQPYERSSSEVLEERSSTLEVRGVVTPTARARTSKEPAKSLGGS